MSLGLFVRLAHYVRRRKLPIGLMGAVLVCGLTLAAHTWAVEPMPAKPALAFKADPTPVEEHGLRLVLVLLLVGGALLGGAYLVKKRMPQWSGLAAGDKRLRVVDKVRMTPRCTLYLISLDGREMLIGHSGDNLVQLEPPHAGADGC